jgi:Holliday junction resolvasome RuvABC endonuclease subunit
VDVGRTTAVALLRFVPAGAVWLEDLWRIRARDLTDPAQIREVAGQVADACAGADVVVLERGISAVRTSHATVESHELRGAILARLAGQDALIERMAPVQVKRYAAGSGRATKRDVAEAVRAVFGEKLPRDPHTMDAVAIALACIARDGVAPCRRSS